LDELTVSTDTTAASELVIRDEVDKVRYGRKLPLTDAARAALDSITPDNDLIFGRSMKRLTPRCERRELNPHGSYPTGT
jgi:hypothetical protein